MSTGVENTSTNDPTPRNVEPKEVGTAAPAPPNPDDSADTKTVDESPDAASKAEPEDGYPEQKHAGKVGYGPNFNQGGGIGDQITGKVEELKGKVLHKPELVEHGKKVGTGEYAIEKRQKEQEEADKESNPFQNPDEKKDEAKKEEKAERSDEPSKKDEIEAEAAEKKNK